MAQSTLDVINRLKAAAAEYERRGSVSDLADSATGELAAARSRLEAVGQHTCAARGRSLNLADLEGLEPSPELLRDLRVCLRSDDLLALSTGFFYLNALTLRRSIESLPDGFFDFLRERIPQLLDHAAVSVSSEAIHWFSVLGNSVENYRGRMLQFLISNEPALRKAALHWYGGYAKAGEIEPLLVFEEDSFASEAALLGPWEYVLRDRAFAIIEKQLGRSFPNVRKRAPYEGSTVSWRDWQPFLAWYRSQKLRIVK
jgi:hypothetical protein